MNNQEKVELIKKYLEGKCSPEEAIMVESWYDDWNVIDRINHSETELNEAERAMRNIIFQHIEKPLVRLWPKLVVAALVLIVSSVTIYFFSFQNENQERKYVEVNKMIVPGGNKAYLTLSNGKKISLKDVKPGELIEESGIRVTKTADGKIQYQRLNNGVGDVSVDNIIETPKGGEYQLVLQDGTKVWLNAESALIYPTNFPQSKLRQVELKGEAYFEVAKRQKSPFIVNTLKQTITVLGTHFNINAYADEQVTKTTLLEGRVSVSDKQSGESVLLKPGDQSIISNGLGIKIQQVDTESSIAWKDGYFMFANENVESVMRKLSRWYNVEIDYAGVSSKEGFFFYGTVNKYENLDKVLRILETASNLQFKTNGNKIKVLTKNTK